MKISTLPQLYRNVNRTLEIVSVLSKYGLAGWLARLNVDFVKGLLKDRDGEALARQTREVRIRLALTELGPTFIKLGQILAMRPDLAGIDLACELSKLHEGVPADSPHKVRATIEQELGQPVEELFVDFDDVAIASASVGQVHRARLPGGEEVVVKVQRAGIREKMRRDLEVLVGLAQLAELVPELAPFRPVATVAEFQRTLRRELDFGREEQHLSHFASALKSDATVRVPKVYVELCTPRVLTMEWFDGIKLSKPQQLAESDYDLEEIARHGAELYLRMIFLNGCYHADPHPGNILLLPGGVIGLLDFGQIGRIDQRLREDMEEMLIAIAGGDAEHLASLIMRVGSPPPGLDEAALSSDVADYVSIYGALPLDRFNLSGALTELTEIIHRHHIMLPAQAGLLIKVLVQLEGTVRLLSPKFNLMEVIRPYQRRLLLRRLSPVRRMKKMRRMYMELEHLAERLPGRVLDIMDQIQAGKFDVHLQHRRLGPAVNRLVLGMMTSALFIGSSLLLSRKVPPLLFPEEPFWGMHELSILGLTGCTVSVLVGLRLSLAIFKSGPLDRPE